MQFITTNNSPNTPASDTPQPAPTMTPEQMVEQLRAIRSQIGRLGPEWSIVINPRRKALDAPFAELQREMERLFLRCGAS